MKPARRKQAAAKARTWKAWTFAFDGKADDDYLAGIWRTRAEACCARFDRWRPVFLVNCTEQLPPARRGGRGKAE